MFSSLNVLPTLGVSLNGGIALSRRWSIRFSLFPNSSISLPTSASQLKNYNIAYEFGAYRGRVSYVLLEDKKFSPGISLSGFVGYTAGSMTVQTAKQTLSSQTDYQRVYSTSGNSYTDFTVTTTPSYYAEAICAWSSIIAGPELRMWFNLDFIFPYLGYGLGFQYSLISTKFNLNNDVRMFASMKRLPEPWQTEKRFRPITLKQRNL
jgi:hypothetical protein